MCFNNGLLYSPKAKVVFLLYLAWHHLKWKYLRARWFRFILSIKNSMHLSGKFYSALSNWRPKFVFTGWKLCLNKVVITIARIESPFALADLVNELIKQIIFLSLLNIGYVSIETNEDVRMYIEEFILVEIWIHCCTKLNWITLEKCWFIYTRNKGMRYVRIALRSQLTSED